MNSFLVLILLTITISLIGKAQGGIDTLLPNVICVVETMPQFPGNSDAMFKFIAENLKYPNGRICVEGKVYVQFIVKKDGGITSVKTYRGVHPLFDAEAERIVK